MAEVEEKTRRSRRGGVRVVLKDTTNSRDAQKSAKEKFKKKVFKDPDALRVFRASEAERKRRAYHARKDDENERDKLKEKWKRNAKAYRERKRAEKLAAHANGSSGNKGKPGTRQEKKAHDEKKQKHADYMRQYRAGMSRQKRTAVNRKRMEQYYMSKEQEVHSVPTDHVPVAAPCQSSPTLQPTSSQQTPPPPSQSPLRDISQPPTKTALQKATQRFRNILGKGARAAHVLKRLIKSADRETKESYRKLNITADTPEKTPAAIVGAFEKMKKKRNKTAIAAKKLIYENAPSMPRPRARKRPVSSKTKAKMIADFYESQSVPLPSKKTVSSKTKQQVRVLDKSVKKLYKDFVKLNPSCSVSKSTFYRHRPHHVKLYTKFPKYQCLCDICQNVSLKLKVLNKFLPVDVQMRDKYDFQKNLMCFGDEPNPDCISMTCTACGPSILKDKLFSSIPFDTLSKWTTWFSWEYKIQSDGKKKKCLEEKSNSVKQLINDLITEATDSIFSQHVFVAKWQQEKFHDLCNNLRDHSAVLVIDYAENYRCSYQSEIQSAYFAYKQVTVHPAVVYYKCSDCGKRVNHYFMFVSDDHLHDAHFSHHCQKKVIEHLKEKGIDYLYIRGAYQKSLP